MKKQLILAAIAVVASFLFLSGPAMAGPHGAVHLNWGYYLNSGDTACPAGKPVINVTRKIINSLDSGTGKNVHDTFWWAYSDFVQHIKVVETEDGFCATVTYKGKVESVGGDGPGCSTDENDDCFDQVGLAAEVTATFQGGFTRNLTGEFDPQEPTKGNLGTLDAACNAAIPDGGCAFSASRDWLEDYFPGGSWANYLWWGYVYHAGNHGSWVNAADPPGNQGNITGE
jgi:hypothetical protein